MYSDPDYTEADNYANLYGSVRIQRRINVLAAIILRQRQLDESEPENLCATWHEMWCAERHRERVKGTLELQVLRESLEEDLSSARILEDLWRWREATTQKEA